MSLCWWAWYSMSQLIDEVQQTDVFVDMTNRTKPNSTLGRVYAAEADDRGHVYPL